MRSGVASGVSRTVPGALWTASGGSQRRLGTSRERLGPHGETVRGRPGSVRTLPEALRRRLWDVRSRFGGDLGGASFDEAYRAQKSIVFRRCWRRPDLDSAAQAQCFVRFRTFSPTHASEPRNDPKSVPKRSPKRPKSTLRDVSGRFGRPSRSTLVASNRFGRPSRSTRVASAPSGRPGRSNQARSTPLGRPSCARGPASPEHSASNIDIDI